MTACWRRSVKHLPISAASAGEVVVLAHRKHRIGRSRPLRSGHEIKIKAVDPNNI